MAADDLSEAEAREIIALRKLMSIDEMTWMASPENSAFMFCPSPLVDESGATLPSLTVEIAFRIPARFDDCKYTFTIYVFHPGGRRRAYQLEVIPVEDRGHNDDGASCYGPHEHIGTLAQEVRIGRLDCRHHEQWFREFLSRANIGYGGRYFGPNDGGLFT